MNFRKINLSILILLMSFGAFGQHKSDDNLLFVLRQTNHVTQALNTAEQLRSLKTETDIHPCDIVIIVCGESVKDFVGSKNNAMVERARQLNVKIYACGLSLNKFGISKTSLMPGVLYTENGLIKAFELQKQGYLSVEL